MCDSIHRRKGRFTISRLFIEKYPDIVMDIMANVIIFRAEVMWHNDVIEYAALSPYFDIMEMGVMIPEYELIFDFQKNDFTFKRM